MGVRKIRGAWWIDYYVHGKRHRERIGHSHKLAEEVLHKRKLEVAEGKFFPERQITTIGFSDMADLYWELHAKSRSSNHVVHYQLIQQKRVFGNTPLDKISKLMVITYLNDVRDRCSAATANRHHNTLRAIINRAIEWEKFKGPNPAAKVRQFKVDNARTRFLENDEKDRLLAACDDKIKPIVLVALLTGMRQSEILNLQWDHIDFTNGLIHVLKTKSGYPREIPIAGHLSPLLTALNSGNGGRLFDLSCRATNRHFNQAAKAAGIVNFRFHDLRHTFASDVVMRTNDLLLAQHLLGHRTIRMTQRYAHLAQGHIQAGMKVFNDGWTPLT